MNGWMDEQMDKNLLPLSLETERYKSHLKGKHSSLWPPVSQCPHHNSMGESCIALHCSAALCIALHCSAALCIALPRSALETAVCRSFRLGGNWLTSTAELVPVFVSGAPGEGKLLLPLRPF